MNTYHNLDEGELVRLHSNPNNPYGATEDGFALRYHRDQFPQLYGIIGAYATDLSINIPGFSTEPESGALGVASFASGFNTTASGDFSTATGFKTKATGNFSSANGNSTQANGDGSFAAGTGSKANGRNSFSVGENNEANGVGSVALGANNKANGQTSFTSGDSNEANGINATATGLNNRANGDNSTSLGQFNITDGQVSSAFGDHLVSNSYAEVSLGSYNEVFTPFDTAGSNENDVALGIGVGLNESSRKNALTIFKNGVQRWLKKTLSSLTNIIQGDHAVDQNGVLNRYDGSEWLPYLTYSYFNTTGRFYLDANRWRGLGRYGHNYYQLTTSAGTGATPVYSYINKGYLVDSDQKLKSIKLNIERDRVQNVDVEIDISVRRNNTTVPITTITDTEYQRRINTIYDVDLDFDLQENDMIIWSARKVGGSTTRMYGYYSMTFKFSK